MKDKDITVEKKEKKECCGCSACADICPTHAIEMISDEEGFLYPKVNINLCVSCGKCIHSCGFNPVDKSLTPPKAFAVKHIDDKVRMSSRSGAAFIAFSDVILRHSGVIYGASMQADFSVRHCRALNENQRDLMKKAKYVQSSTIDIFPQVAQDLNAGKEVLFSGTPCQVAGLHSYLSTVHIDDSKLYCCDLVCHGVPSPAIWKDYVSYIGNKYGKEILKANFRDKEFGWNTHFESFVLKDKKRKIVRKDYTDLFYQHIMFRPSCHNCYFASIYRPGDLTLADFWGIEKNDASFNDNKGVSLVLVSTEKGLRLFYQAQKYFQSFECEIENCLQPTLIEPSSVSPRREKFWEDYKKMDFSKFLKKYTTPENLKAVLKKKIKEILCFIGLRRYP